MDKKNCLICNKEFFRYKRVGFRDWNKQKFCSRECLYKNQSLNPSKSSFKKGSIPWNNGVSGYMTEEAKKTVTKNLNNYIKNEKKEQRDKRTFQIRTIPKIATMTGKKGDICPHWKGEQATYNAKHRWIQVNWQKTGICELCLIPRPARKGTRLKWGTHWANKSGEYKRERSDWYELCPKCHKIFDKR